MPLNDDTKPAKAGIGLALSGGGFRATLFHIGSLWRLNELGWLPKVAEITSVSGGSIAAAYLGVKWRSLKFDDAGIAINFESQVATPLRAFCAQTIDFGSIVGGILNPFMHPSELLRNRYDKDLFRKLTLQDLPADGEGPRFTIYATNLQTGVSVRLSRSYIGDYRLGLIDDPKVTIASAVAASSAFPPVYVPMTLKFKASEWRRVEGADLFDRESLRTTLRLGDGGIYDNMALERVWDSYETVLVSDAGAPYSVDESAIWLRFSQVARTKRTLDISLEQNRALRKRKLIDDFQRDVRAGTYWGIASSVANYELEQSGRAPPIATDNDLTRSLASVRTRLNAFSEEEQGRLINWGYALTDTAMRRYILDAGATPGAQPVPAYTL